MHILTRWGFRMDRANMPRTVRTILSAAAFFALLTGSWFISDGLARVENASGRGLYWILEHIVFYTAIAITVVMLFSVFSVVADECRQDERSLSSTGATRRQVFRSLVYRVLALDLIGVVGGTAVGLLLSRVVLDGETFRKELDCFFSLQTTYTILIGGLLVAPCTMLLAALFAFLPLPRRRHRAHSSKRWLLRSTLERRVFGVGGAIGRMSSHNNRYRVIFTLSFAAALTVTAILADTMQLMSQTHLVDANADLTLEYMNYADDAPVQRKVDSLLETCSANGWIADSTTMRSSFLNAGYNCYCVLDSDWLTEDALRLQNKKRIFDVYRTILPFESDGKSMQYCPLYNVVFLDDAAFDRFAKENRIDAGTDGTILYTPGWVDRTTTPFLRLDAPKDVRLRFLPETFEYTASDAQAGESGDSFELADYVRAADSVSLHKVVRLAGSVRVDPYPDGSLSHSFLPEWIVPERLEALFAYMPQQSDPSAPTSKTTVFLHTQAHREVCDLFEQAFDEDPDCELVNLHFGIGGKHADTEKAGKETAPNVLYAADLQAQQAELDAFHKRVPLLRALLLLFSTGMLFIGIFNTSHMNRLTRRREKAILESIGLGQRQKTGMLLFESVQYAIRSTLYSLVGFAVYFVILYRLIPINMFTEHIDMHPDDLNHALSVYVSPGMVTQSFLQTCGRVWWAFAGGAVLLFLALVVTDMLVDRHYNREELIQILTDDTQYGFV